VVKLVAFFESYVLEGVNRSSLLTRDSKLSLLTDQSIFRLGMVTYSPAHSRVEGKFQKRLNTGVSFLFSHQSEKLASAFFSPNPRFETYAHASIFMFLHCFDFLNLAIANRPDVALIGFVCVTCD
jgi:hypothetical protein